MMGSCRTLRSMRARPERKMEWKMSVGQGRINKQTDVSGLASIFSSKEGRFSYGEGVQEALEDAASIVHAVGVPC